MPDFPLLFIFRQLLENMIFLKHLEPFLIHGVAQVKIKIFHLAALQLLLKIACHIRFLFQIPHGKLAGKVEAFSRVFFHCLAQKRLRLMPVIRIGGIKVIDAVLDGVIDHLFRLFHVDVVAARSFMGKAHTPQPQ